MDITDSTPLSEIFTRIRGGETDLRATLVRYLEEQSNCLVR